MEDPQGWGDRALAPGVSGSQGPKDRSVLLPCDWLAKGFTPEEPELHLYCKKRSRPSWDPSVGRGPRAGCSGLQGHGVGELGTGALDSLHRLQLSLWVRISVLYVHP